MATLNDLIAENPDLGNMDIAVEISEDQYRFIARKCIRVEVDEYTDEPMLVFTLS